MINKQVTKTSAVSDCISVCEEQQLLYKMKINVWIWWGKFVFIHATEPMWTSS